MNMLSKLIPNTSIYVFNYIKYKFLYFDSFVSPRSFLMQVKLGKKNIISGGVYMHNCQVGDYTYISGNEGGGIVSGFHHVTIGKYCSFGTKVEIITESSHNKDFVSTFPFFSMPNSFGYAKNKSQEFTSRKPVTIGNDVWIGSNVTILGGINIGNGAIIGAGAVITKDVEPYAIVVGNPAAVTKYRFTPETIKSLLEIKWWDWSEEKIKKNIDLIMSANLEKFINAK